MTFDQISLILTQINDYYYYRKKESFPFYIYLLLFVFFEKKDEIFLH